MAPNTSSVLIPSLRRTDALEACLDSLAQQQTLPTEVIVVWQRDDYATRDAAEGKRSGFPVPLRVLHCDEMGIVAAENLALTASTGDLVLMLDDDVVAPPDWVQRHTEHYLDTTVGAVGGPAVNFAPDGTKYPVRKAEPQGRITWYGKTIGNMHDHPDGWRDRELTDVDHLVGYNLSFRRSALGVFEAGLRPYWQMFEMDACLQVAGSGQRVLFDYSNVVEHHPTNPAFAGGREGDLQTKIYNAAFNRSFVLAKHSRSLQRGVRLAYLLLVGTVGTPGLVGFLVATARFGSVAREFRILGQTLRHTLAGWRAGARVRAQGSK